MSSRGTKRARTAPAFAQRRPIDKQLKALAHTATTTATGTTLFTTTYPATLTGLRWDFSSEGMNAARTHCSWYIIVVRDGLAAGGISLTDGSDAYTPEGDVLAFGSNTSAGTTIGVDLVQRNAGQSKAQRKLQAGDTIVFLTLADTASAHEYNGIVQFFLKG